MILYQSNNPYLRVTDTKLTRLETSEYTLPTELQEEIDTLWQEEIDKASLEGKQLFDDTILTFASYSKEQNEIFTRDTPYRIRFIAKKYPHIGDATGKLRALFTHIILRTNDDYYIFGKKSEHYVTDLTTCFIGGALNSGISLADHAYEELREEIGITENSAAPLFVQGIYENGIGNVGIILKSDIAMSSEEFSKHFNSWIEQQAAPELTGILLVHQSELSDFMNRELSNYPDVAGVINE